MANPIARWNPLQDIAAMQHEMDRFATGLGMPWRVGAFETGESVMMPSIDIMTRGDDMVIHADIPGVTPDSVDISVTDSMLTLKAKRDETREINKDDYVVRERSWGTFERTMRLPRGVDASAIHAEYNDGVLEVVIPGGAKQTESEAVHVPIKARTKKSK